MLSWKWSYLTKDMRKPWFAINKEKLLIVLVLILHKGFTNGKIFYFHYQHYGC
jgi:hypothetical protein